MSKTITTEQLNANTSVYSVDDYRHMVNYESGTNKGYVRFTKASDGKLKIEKFNNKIDVPLSWRSNVSAAHNKAVREKFLSAMGNDLRYMGDAANTIRNTILAPKNPDGDVASPGKALSRREVKNALELFDAEFNTGSGRTRILKNFMEHAKIECGFHGSDDEFARDYLKTKDIGVDHRLTEYITSKEGDEANALPQHLRMVKSEAEFRNLLRLLGNLVDNAKQRISVETTLKSVATALAKDGGEYGTRFTDDDEGKVRAALVKLLEKADMTDVDLGFGTKNTALEMFIKNVVPVLVKECAANIKDLPKKDDAAIASVLDADLNIDRVFSLAKDFIEGAKKAVEDTKDAPKEGASADAVDKYIAGMKQIFETQMATVKKVAVFSKAREVFVLNMNGGKQTNLDLAKEVGSLTPEFLKEAKLDIYTATFLKDHFARSVDAEVKNEGDFMKKANDVMEHVKIAGQINFGERWQTNPDAKTLADVRLKAGGNVQSFIGEMGRRVAEIVNDKKGGLPLYEKLMSLTLTAILNEKIRNAAGSNGLARIHIDAESFADVETRLRRTVDAYCAFRDDKGAVIVEKAVDAFRRQLDRLKDKNNISQQAYNTLLTDFQNRMKTAFNNAVTRFLSVAPRAADLDAAETKEADLTILVNALNEEKGAALADMRERIATMVLTRGFNQDVRKALITDMNERINECADKLKQDGVTTKFTTSDATMGEALKKLYYKVLADKCGSKAIAGQRIDNSFVDKIKSAFYSAAKDLVKNANRLAETVDKELKTMAGVAIADLFETRESRRNYKTDLSKKEYEAMQESLRADLILALKTRTDELKRTYLLNPEAYTKKNVGDFKAVGEIFDHVGKDGFYTQDSINRIFEDIIGARQSAVLAWITNPTGPDGKGTLEGDLIAGEMQRLAESTAGKAGEYAAKLPANERTNIVSAAVKAVLASAEKYAQSYSCGGKAAFMKRVSEEVQAIVDRRVETQAKFREQIVKDAAPFIANYVDALRTGKKDGAQVATDKLNSVLDEISRQKEPPAAKGFAFAFDGMLRKLVDDRTDMKMDEFLAYSAKVTAAYEKCIPAFNEALERSREEFKAAGATDDDLKFFDEKLAPVMRGNIETNLQKNIDAPNLSENAAAYGRVSAEGIARLMKIAIKEADMSNPTSLHAMLSEMGMKILYSDVDTDKATQEAVATWMKSPEVQKLVGELRRAKMTIVACGENSMCQAAKDARAKIDEFKNALRGAIMGLKTSLLETTFNTTQIAPAMNLFKIWLKQYDLPDIKVTSAQGDVIKLVEAAERHFNMRIAEMQRKIAFNPDTKEPLLSADYLKDFTSYLNRIGTQAMFSALSTKLINSRVDEIIAKPENTDLYNYKEQYGNDENANVRRYVMQQNASDLSIVIGDILYRTEQTMKEVVVSLEDMKRWEDVIQREFTSMVSDESVRLEQFHKFARSRIAMMTAIDIDTISGEAAIVNNVMNALKDYFNGEDIFHSTKLTASFIKKNKVDLPALVQYLTDMTRKTVRDTIKNLKERAMQNVQPGAAPYDLLPSVKELTKTFKNIAKSYVETTAEDKKLPHAAALKAIAKELKLKK